MSFRPRPRGGPGVRLHARTGTLLAAVVTLAVSACSACSGGSAVPSPFTLSPAPPGTPSATTTARTISPAPASAASTVPAHRTASASPSSSSTTLNRLVLSFPGIKRTVVVDSAYNSTTRGHAALVVVGIYNSELAIATSRGSTARLERVVSSSCVNCIADIERQQELIRRGERLTVGTGAAYWSSLSLRVVRMSSEHVVVRSDAAEPAVTIRDRRGRTVDSSRAALLTSYFDVEFANSAAKIASFEDTT